MVIRIPQVLLSSQDVVSSYTIFVKKQLVCSAAFFAFGQPDTRDMCPECRVTWVRRSPVNPTLTVAPPAEMWGHTVTHVQDPAPRSCAGAPGPARCWGLSSWPQSKGCRNPGGGFPQVLAKLRAPTCHPCIDFLELSKSQNDMTSDKQRPAVGPRQCEGRSERRSQSDTAVNVTTRVSQASGRPKVTLLPVFSIGFFILLLHS